MKSIARHSEKVIECLATEYPAVLVIGARQTGKTTILRKITKQNQFYI